MQSVSVCPMNEADGHTQPGKPGRMIVVARLDKSCRIGKQSYFLCGGLPFSRSGDVFFILVWFYVIELNYRIIRFFEACFRLRSYTNSPQGIPHSVKLILNFGACFVIFLNIMYLLFWLYEKRPTACLWAAAIGLVKVYRSFFAPLCLVYMRNSGKVFLLFRRDILPSFPAFPNQSFSISSTGSPVISAMSFSRYPLAFIALALRSFSFSMPSAKPSARPSFFPSKRPSS